MSETYRPQPLSPEDEAKKAAFEAYRAEQMVEINKGIEQKRKVESLSEADLNELTPPQEHQTPLSAPETDTEIDDAFANFGLDQAA